MQKIKLKNKTISYTLRKSRRARRLRLAVYCDGTIVVTMPHDLRETMIEKFIKEKSDWLLSKISFFKQFQGRLVSRYSHDDYLKYKEDAFRVVEQKVKYFSELYNFRYNKINIKNQKTRWGSCSRKGNLNFNYKFLFLPEKVQDYIVVHELCHLKEFNHSRKFWGLVEQILPNYLEVKNKLRNRELFLN